MRPLITVTAVVILHLCVLAVLVGVNGCRSTSVHELESPADLAAFSGGLRRAALPAKPVAASARAPAPVSAGLTPVPVAPELPTPPPSPVVASPKATPGSVITVIKGETLFSIARRQGITSDALAAANGLPNNAMLRVGQRLKIPAAGPAAPRAPAPKASSKSAAPEPAPQFEPLKLIIIGSPKAAESEPAKKPAN